MRKIILISNVYEELKRSAWSSGRVQSGEPSVLTPFWDVLSCWGWVSSLIVWQCPSHVCEVGCADVLPEPPMEEQEESGSSFGDEGRGGQGPWQEYGKHTAAKWGGSDQLCKVSSHWTKAWKTSLEVERSMACQWQMWGAKGNLKKMVSTSNGKSWKGSRLVYFVVSHFSKGWLLVLAHGWERDELLPCLSRSA